MTSQLRRRALNVTSTPGASKNVDEQIIDNLLAEPGSPEADATPVATTQTPATPKKAVPSKAIFANAKAPVATPDKGSFMTSDAKVALFREQLIASHKNFEGITVADTQRLIAEYEKFIIQNSANYDFNVGGTKMKRRTVSGRFYMTPLAENLIVYVPEHVESTLRVAHRQPGDTVYGLVDDDGSYFFGTYNDEGELVESTELTERYGPMFEEWDQNRSKK